MKKLNVSFALLLASLCASANASAYTLGQYINKAENWLKCEEMQLAERAVCNIVSQEVNAKLNAAGIRLDHGDVIYDLNGFTNVDRKEGCKKLKTLGSNLRVNLNTHMPLRFEGNVLDAPFVATISLPAHIHADIRVREQTRTNYFGSCADPTTSDDWNIVADADVDSHSKLIVSMEPRYEVRTNGDYDIIIKPFVGVESVLDDVDMRTRIRGREHPWFSLHDGINAITGIHTGVFANTPLFLIGWMDRDSYMREWSKVGVYAGSAVVSSVLTVDNAVLDQAIQAKLSRMAETEAAKTAREQVKRLEATLNARISQALRLDANGEYRFMVPFSSLPTIMQPQRVDFTKHGNNGTVSCNTFCEGAQWGELGACVGATRADTGQSLTCSTVPGYLQGPELTCQCVRPFIKHGNNGTVSCDTYCRSSRWPGGTGRCLTANRMDRNGESVPCENAVGFIGPHELTCGCAPSYPSF